MKTKKVEGSSQTERLEKDLHMDCIIFFVRPICHARWRLASLISLQLSVTSSFI